LRVYYNLQPGGQKTRPCLFEIFSELNAFLDTGPIYQLVEYVPGKPSPAGLGVEYSSDAPAKIKVYYRSRRGLQKPAVDDLIRSAGFAHHQKDYDLFHRSIAGDQTEYPERSMIFYAGLESGQGAPTLSVYFILRAFFHGDQSAHRGTLRLLDGLQIDGAPYELTLRQIVARQSLPDDEVRFHNMIGMGFAERGIRLNVYLKPSLHYWQAASAAVFGDGP